MTKKQATDSLKSELNESKKQRFPLQEMKTSEWSLKTTSLLIDVRSKFISSENRCPKVTFNQMKTFFVIKSEERSFKKTISTTAEMNCDVVSVTGEQFLVLND